MTLAAAYMIGNVPVLLSDTLITGGSGDEHQPIATRADLNEALPLRWGDRVRGLHRKSIKFGQNAAVAVAGNGLTLSLIFRKLEKIPQDQFITTEILFAMLAGLDVAASSMMACTLVGWIVDESGPHSFQWETMKPDNIQWDDDYVSGTGAHLFRQMSWSTAQRTWTHIQSFDDAQHYALKQVSSLLVNEISNGAPIQNLFGGGYDLLLWDGTRFRQAADVTFLFLSLSWLQAQNKGLHDAAPILIRQAELENCLVVRAIIPTNQLGVTSDPGERVAIIAPISFLNRKHAFQRVHDASEIPHFAERIFVNITGVGKSGCVEHWSAGAKGEDAKLFGLEADQVSGKLHIYLPREVMDNMRKAAEKQLGFGEIPPAI